MHQQLWGYKVEWKSVSRGTGGKEVEYHCSKEIGWEGVDRIQLALDREQWLYLANTVMNLPVP
jgi:hypothetical protein